MFQSAPRVRTRGDSPTMFDFASVFVSIRAPRPHAGRRKTFNPIDYPKTFQSAPRVRTRGDWTW